MPETTIHMTCGPSGKTVKLRLTGGGDVKSEVVEGKQPAGAPQGDES
jgi:hypothetical protein